MGNRSILEKIINQYKWLKVDLFARRTIKMQTNKSYISFTFDDFPRSSYLMGGKILKNHGLTGTYYISVGLMNKMEAPWV